MIQSLTRDEFREGVFIRDDHKCVVCSAPNSWKRIIHRKTIQVRG